MIYKKILFVFVFFLCVNSIFALTGSLSPSRIDYSGEIGKTFSKTLTIKNLNDFDVNVSVSTNLPNIVFSKTSFIISANSNYSLPFNMTILKNGYEEGKINVRLKKGLEFFDIYTTINIYGYSNFPSNPNFGEIIESINVNPATPFPEIGKDFIINVKIKNVKNVKTNYSISIDGYENFAELLNIYPQNTFLGPYESDDVKIQIYIKNDSKGFKTFNIKVMSDDNFYEEVPYSINVKDNSDLTDIAYLVRNNPDYNIINVINELGYDYDIIDISKIPTTNFSQYKMILLGNEKIYNVSVNNYKSLILNPDYYSGWSSSIGFTTNPKAYVYNQNISITKNLSRNFNIYNSQNKLYYLTKQKKETKAVVTTGSSLVDIGRFVVAVKENPRRVFFGAVQTNYWSSEGRELFKNSIEWIIKGEDKDKDGYAGDLDCNDNNPSLWRNVKAYIDKDKDGFGTGELINACIGDKLTAGYSYINKDCNDNNNKINPGEKEIPYNGIDEDCDGYDLADVDGDGYCKAGYLIQNNLVQCKKDNGIGSDCNDEDKSYNVESEDVYKNCKNDAPIIQDIQKISVFETEEVTINVNAVDPENDILNYSIDDNRFSKNNNKFVWKTGYTDVGNYSFRIEVSDGNLTSYAYVNVEVKEKNRVPVCNLTDVNWRENEYKSINLDNYCYDEDNDKINYSLYRFGEGLMVTMDKNLVNLSSEEYWFGDSFVEFKLSDGKEDNIIKINVNVSPVNQGPVLIENIGDIILYENKNSIDSLNLDYYFFDRDSNLSYSVSGNNNVRIEINKNLVSFYPKEGFFGEETVVFNATDGEFSESSEAIIKVLYVRKAPKFLDINCTTSLIEDTIYSCYLDATDAENDSFSFEVIKNDNLNCSVEGNRLDYVGFKDYTGDASCKLRVKDNDGYSDMIFNVSIENVNDPPHIEEFSPSVDNVKIYNDTEKIFRIYAKDVDKDNLNISWKLDNEEVGNGSFYYFKKTFGRYNLLAIISDGEFNLTKSWSIYVGLTNDFTCKEMGGYVCNEKQVCKGEILNVYDSGSCCSITCSDKPPEFKDIKRENKTGEISIDIIEPSNLTQFKTGDKMPIEIKTENFASENINADVFIYLYDGSKENVIEKIEDSFRLNKKSSKNSLLQMEIPRKLKENNDFYLFTKIIGNGKENSYYDEKFIKIDIERKEGDVVIENVGIEPVEIVCGDDLNVKVDLKNYGSSPQNVYVSFKSPVINESKKSYLRLEDYLSDKDSKEKIFNLKTIDNINPGEYEFKIRVDYDNSYVEDEKNISVKDCKKEETKTQIIDKNITTIKLESRINSNDRKLIFSLISFLTMLFVSLIFLIITKSYFKRFR